MGSAVESLRALWKKGHNIAPGDLFSKSSEKS